MLQFLAIVFFLVALLVPLAIVTVTLQQSGRAILSALHGERRRTDLPMRARRLRIHPPASWKHREDLRAAA